LKGKEKMKIRKRKKKKKKESRRLEISEEDAVLRAPMDLPQRHPP